MNKSFYNNNNMLGFHKGQGRGQFSVHLRVSLNTQEKRQSGLISKQGIFEPLYYTDYKPSNLKTVT